MVAQYTAATFPGRVTRRQARAPRIMTTPTPDPSSAAARGSGLGPRIGAAVAIAIGVAVALRLMGGGQRRDATGHEPERGERAGPGARGSRSRGSRRSRSSRSRRRPSSATRPSARALNTALEPYRKGDYVAAATALDGFLLDHPDDPVATLYLGISRLFMDEPQNALEILRGMPGSASEQVMAEAEWYSVVGIARLRDPSAAEAEARTLCERKGPASRPRVRGPGAAAEEGRRKA